MPDAVSGLEDLVIDRATPEDWAIVTEWAAGEGWNPGAGDAAAFFAQDPNGFFLGRLGGEPVSAISVVNYGSDYAFLGFYLVRPDLRGHGLGLATWRTGLAHAGGRVVGLDGVPDQQDNYRRSGFELAYRSARFAGVPDLPPTDGTVRPMSPDDAVAVYRYDSACLPADRPEFLAEWLGGPGRRTVVRVVDGELTGFAQARPSRDGLRVGPLFADTAADARQLLSALAEFASGTPLAVDVPLRNEPAVKLMTEAGLTPSFETARMYTGRVRNHHQDKVFGVTSLELG
ncbi:GNAT family N-acetyltransferase [Nocardia huaxiensis]|uniref:GNAT family N-acetyltransferase n=1 Tax=Nocardia huaxiensis TaxID=2755382 RepID=A0A7D6VI06_9NOCA|nr:GNAT family N-acetyltransferase [Nocardia huaxiensis]QLY30436.1 GNAT family N-acetyltransferase [Nocardia huaxiensis]UFS95965.1 GNAT family N-acetyltransferase [Nocardia huaxiensis]